jgi:hypothetical protein
MRIEWLRMGVFMRRMNWLGVVVGAVVLLGAGEIEKPLPEGVWKATTAYRETVAKVQEEHSQKMAAAMQKYMEGLDAAMKPVMASGDLAMANRIQVLKDEAAAGGDPQLAAPATAGRVFLSDMEEADWNVKFGLGKKGRLVEYKITVDKKYSPNGLGMHPEKVGDKGDSFATFRLNGGFKIFKASVALNDSSKGAESAMTFKVLGDEKVLWKSKAIQRPRENDACTINVTGVRVIKLVVECAGSITGAHGVWVEPMVLK